MLNNKDIALNYVNFPFASKTQTDWLHGQNGVIWEAIYLKVLTFNNTKTVTRHLGVAGVLLVFCLHLGAQTCSGSLGENIFTDGDFGVGVPYILPVDPLIAPGYTYSTTTPVSDGRYTITNDVAQWANAYNWLRIKNNSPDPNGYMMVVNASFTPGLFYRQTVDGLCDGTTYEFTADIFNMIPPGTNLILPNVSFLIDSVQVYNTGNVPENGRWNTYGFTFSTKPGQGSVTLSLRNNAPGGNGNDLAIDNITFRPCGPQAYILPSQTAYGCQEGAPIRLAATVIGNQYPTPYVQWQRSSDMGVTWSDIPGETDTVFFHTLRSQGQYYYRFLAANSPFNLLNSKCRVASTPKVVEILPKFFTAQDTFCQGLGYLQGNRVYTTNGTYVDTLISSRGCDSIVTLELVFLPDPGITATVTPKDPSCDYLVDGSIAISNVQRGTLPLAYFFNNRQNFNGGVSANLPPGTYSCAVVDRYGCRFDTAITLVNPPPFVVNIAPVLPVDLGDPLQLSTSANFPVDLYSWMPADMVNCSTNCGEVTIFPTLTQFLGLQARSDKGCIATDSAFIHVNKVRYLYIPNAFTPNGDGLNEVFSPVASMPNVKEVEELRVFNRWGALVFENANFDPNDLSQGWNGTYQGSDAPSGVFMYQTKVRFLDGQLFTYSGAVTLVR